MLKVVFHIGMGKTGSTAIQKTLGASAEPLAAAGQAYLGLWMGAVQPEFDGYQGFQAFLRQPPDSMEGHARAFLATLKARHKETGAHTFIVSNEQYLENLPVLAKFLRFLSRRVDLKIVAFVRPAASWLPSAYVQWGVVHKTNPGAVQPFAIKARKLIRQYDFVRRWNEVFGPHLTVLPVDDKGDAVQDFARFLGIALPAGSQRHQARPAPDEILLRAAFNNARPDVTLPDSFNALHRKVPPRTPAGLRAKFDHVFDYGAIPEILAENAETLSYIEREFGIPMQGPPPRATDFDPAALTGDLVATMLDLISAQALQIEQLSERLARIEAGAPQE
jgi:hypothetical protein